MNISAYGFLWFFYGALLANSVFATGKLDNANKIKNYIETELKSPAQKNNGGWMSWIGQGFRSVGDNMRGDNYQSVKELAKDAFEYKTGVKTNDTTWSWVMRAGGNLSRYVGARVGAPVEKNEISLAADYIVKNNKRFYKRDLAAATALIGLGYDHYREVLYKLYLRNYDVDKTIKGALCDEYVRGQYETLTGSKADMIATLKKRSAPALQAADGDEEFKACLNVRNELINKIK